MYCGRPRCRPWNGSCGTFCGGGRFAYADHISAYAGVPGDRDSTCIGCPRVGVSAWTYKKNKNIDIRHGVIMLISVLIFTLVGSFVSSLVPNGTMGGFSKGMTLLVGLKFMIRPIMTTKEVQANKSEEQKIRQSILCGVLIGFICGFVGAGGGMMLLLVLTSVLGYELKTAVGTSVFIMTFTALTGAVSHFYIGGKPNLPIMIACVISTLVFAQLGAKWANSANVKMLNRVTGILLCVLGMVMLFF